MASLYLHIPFCEHKCIYCDFYSVESLQGVDAFVDTLKKEISMYDEYAARDSFETIFFGGGTPSLLPAKAVGEILDLLHRTFSVTADAEITLESNPGTVDASKLRDFRATGVNRISFGVQSFFDDDLRFLTRIHSSKEAKHAVREAQRVGFNNISLDLIFALPNQTLDRWKSNLRQAIELQTQHISAYSLIIEDRTPLARMVQSRQVTPSPTETDAELYECTMDVLANHGFEHYEVSNYAKPGFRSRHNYNYWNHSNYLGFGPSAHSFWMNRRWWNAVSLRFYCDSIGNGRLPIAGEELLHQHQLLDEAIMLGLRSDGIKLGRVKDQLGVDLTARSQSVIDHLVKDKLAFLTDTTLRLTDKGFLLCDEISQLLVARV